jgi:hypothetical protein
VVTAAWRPWTCGEFQTFPSDTTTTVGEFEVWLVEWGEFPAACVRVVAQPPPDRALQPASVQLDRVALNPAGGLDTLALPLTLAAP